MRQTATSCAEDKQHGDGHEGRKGKEETFTESGSVLRSEVRSRAHLGQPGQQRRRGSRCLISPNTGPVPRDKGGGTPNRAQNPGVAGDEEGQRKKASPQDTTPKPPTASLCPLRDDQCWPKHSRGRRVTGSRWLHLAGHSMARERDNEQRSGCDTLSLTACPSPEVQTSPSQSPLGLCQWPEPL